MTLPKESYRVSNSVWLRNLKGRGQGPTWAVEPLDGCMEERRQDQIIYTEQKCVMGSCPGEVWSYISETKHDWRTALIVRPDFFASKMISQ
jgi:hypothetical protein